MKEMSFKGFNTLGELPEEYIFSDEPEKCLEKKGFIPIEEFPHIIGARDWTFEDICCCVPSPEDILIAKEEVDFNEEEEELSESKTSFFLNGEAISEDVAALF